ncbi:MAG: PEP-CTERM sorting domain-containing protein [Fimbriimonadaceae bacterium]
MRLWKACLGVWIVFGVAARGLAVLGWNIDLTVPGNPAPSSAFGAALGDEGRGYWNAIEAQGMVPTILKDHDGNDSSVIMSGPSGGVGGENNFQGNTGDFALLLNDGRLTNGDSWSYSGLPLGTYKVIVYAVEPADRLNPTLVSVAGMEGVVTGPMPANRFEDGVTHFSTSFYLTSGSFDISVYRGQFRNAWVNGMQILAVPEPASLMATSFGLLIWQARKRRG